MRRRRATHIALLAAITCLASAGGPRAQDRALELVSFTIEPPFASPGGPARIRFEFRGAQGGLREAHLLAKPATGPWRRSVFEEAVNRAIAALGPLSDGAVEAAARHATGYGPDQRGTSNLYELRVVDRAGRRSEPLTVSLEVRM